MRSNGGKPRILIDEHNGATPYVTEWIVFGAKRALVWGASSASLSNFFLDGSTYFHKNSDRPRSVFLEKATGFGISDCIIEDLYHGLWIQAELSTDSASCTVDNTEFNSVGPLRTWTTPTAEDQGHAGVWIEGAGSVNALFSGCSFSGSHDAIEIAGNNMTDGRLSISNCEFIRNENGIEAVGSGNLITSISDCIFENNYNLDFGMPYFDNGVPFSPGAFVTRGGINNSTSARDCRFTNNAFGVLIKSPGVFDFGESGTSDPGRNDFEFDFSAFPPGTDPLRVALFVQHPPTGQQTVMMGGNTWHPNNQQASSTGCLTGSPQVAFGQNSVNMFDKATYDIEVGIGFVTVPGEWSPGPRFGVLSDPLLGSVEWDRNYAIAPPVNLTDPPSLISFGTDCVP